MAIVDEPLVLGPHSFTSRLFLGTGKYPSMDSMVEALDVSGTECVTVAVRRMEMGVPEGKTLLDYLPRERYTLLPNTAGCFDADHAVRTARLGRELGIGDLVKLEVLADPQTLLPADALAVWDRLGARRISVAEPDGAMLGLLLTHRVVAVRPDRIVFGADGALEHVRELTRRLGGVDMNGGKDEAS